MVHPGAAAIMAGEVEDRSMLLARGTMAARPPAAPVHRRQAPPQHLAGGRRHLPHPPLPLRREVYISFIQPRSTCACPAPRPDGAPCRATSGQPPLDGALA